MQIANAIVALDGDPGQTVGKYDITPSEVALLRAIHGDDAVTSIEITGSIKRSSREELTRLFAQYGSAKNDDNKSIVSTLFPGVAARAFETFDELEMDDTFFVAKPTKASKGDPVLMEAPKKRGRPPKKVVEEEPELPFDGQDDPDPFEEMDDVNNEILG